MGFKAWRNLSALAFAGVALIGCNNGSQKAPAPLPQQGSQIAPGGGTQFPLAQQPKPFTPTPGTASPQFGSSMSQPPLNPQQGPPFMQPPGQVNTLTPQPGAGATMAPSISPGTPPPFNLQSLPPVNPASNPAQPNTGSSPAGPMSGGGPILPAQQPAASGGFASQPGPTVPGGTPGMVPIIPPPNPR